MGVSKGTVQIAYDWLSKTVYWTDSLYRWIIAAPTDMGKITNDYYKIIVDDHLDFPDGIAVDPMNG
jgi:sugar lactone lactonase YvrE